MSLTELVVVIGALGVLTAIVVPNISGVLLAARRQAARTNVLFLNRAVLHFNQSNWELNLPSAANGIDDEIAVLRTLQWRNPDAKKATPGSPYVPARFPSSGSVDPTDYRARWNGKMFELLVPGMSGTGIKIDFDNPGSPAYSFPDDFQPVGPLGEQ